MSILTLDSSISTASSLGDETPRIYVACLASYNSGVLHGAWIDCDQEEYAIQWDIDAMIAESPAGDDAEEWAIHGFENWQGIELSESESVEHLAKLAAVLKEHGKAYGAYCSYIGAQYATVDDFSDSYRGSYESKEAFVEECWEDDGTLAKLEEMGVQSMYIDFDAIARDWFVNDYYSVEVGYNEVFVFHNT